MNKLTEGSTRHSKTEDREVPPKPPIAPPPQKLGSKMVSGISPPAENIISLCRVIEMLKDSSVSYPFDRNRMAMKCLETIGRQIDSM